MSNRLAAESSPYLLQHKDNPVDWFPWGEEAFARARDEGRPIFLSIGYSTCHWCHVMERESFEDATIAGYLNRNFVSIKVDREERPDVDDIYMTAVQAMTGSGGWPLSVFLTADRKPFYGGTYFPREDRYGRPGFLTLLAAITDGWTARRPELVASADALLAHVRASIEGLPGGQSVGAAPLEDAVRALSQRFDRAHGGFGAAPKFPPSMQLELLIRWWLRTGEPSSRHMAERTLEAMAAGGMYDHVGGGFHRYSVDERWLVPHFEKMLYDNAMLARVYLLASRAFGREEFGRVARETLDYLLAEMTPPGGGFCAAQDADSGGEEGTFYVWNPRSLEGAVGPEAAPIVAARFGVDARGNFEGGETVLSVVAGLPDLSREFGRSEEEIAGVLAEARRDLFRARARRVAPATDDKLLTDWTALAISAFALAGRLLKEPRYEAAARDAADRILIRCLRGGELLHRERDSRAGIPGFASDYANAVEALLDLYEATFDAKYFRAALELQRSLDERFNDPRGGYFLTGEGDETLPLRPRETLDAATPASNSVAAMNLLRLFAFTGEQRYRAAAERIFESASGYLSRAAVAVPRLLCALDFRSGGSREVVLSGDLGRSDLEALREAAFASARLNRVLALADSGAGLAGLSPLVEGRGPKEGPALAYVCEDFACRSPVATPAQLREALDG